MARVVERGETVKRIPIRHYTEKGKVVYKRKKHEFNIKDLERVTRKVQRNFNRRSFNEIFLKIILDVLNRCWDMLKDLWRFLADPSLSKFIRLGDTVMEYFNFALKPNADAKELDLRFREWISSLTGIPAEDLEIRY